MQKINILFITWDGPETTYAEGLFMPIYHKIEMLYPQYKFHYLQFTWGKDQAKQKTAASSYNIPYASAPIHRKPMVSLGSLRTIFFGKKHIQKYIDIWNIHILMPRSTFPAYMVSKLNSHLPILLDADGLPIEERIDFAGLKRGSLMHKVLKKLESKAIQSAHRIITRSEKSIEYHKQNYNVDKNKFSVVLNGRDITYFKTNPNLNTHIRAQLQIDLESIVFIYAGSFGPQYGWEEMLNIFKIYHERNNNAHFLFLTNSPERVIPLIPEDLTNNFTVKSVAFDKVASLMSIGNIAFAIRKPTLSMGGVSPIKLGEYLLMGLPTIASKGIGDTERMLEKIPYTFLYDHENTPSKDEILDFLDAATNINKNEIRKKATEYFSLEAAAKSYHLALKNLPSL